MLILKVEYNPIYYNNTLLKLRRIMKNYPIHVDIIRRRETIYLMSLDDGFSVAFLYQAYLKAKEKGLEADLLYARYIDEDWLPEEVKELGRKWLSMKLSEKEIESLKNIHITEYIMGRWCI